MDFKTLEKLGGKITEVSATYSRKMWSNEVGTIGGDYGATAQIVDGADPEAVIRGLSVWLKEVAKAELKESFQAIIAPKTETPKPVEADATTIPPNWCPIHGVEMKQYEKGGSKWYSHKLDDGSWCKGK